MDLNATIDPTIPTPTAPYVGDLADNVHPNDRGYEKMASIWFSALAPVLAGGRPWPLFHSGLEPGETAPTWTDTVQNSLNVGGYSGALTRMETGVRAGVARGGAQALLYSGNDLSATQSYSYNRVWDVHLKIAADTALSYWIRPEQRNGTFVAVDLLFTDGSYLRNANLPDQRGVRAHPVSQGNAGPPGGRPVEPRARQPRCPGRPHGRPILIGYDQPAATGQYRGHLDDIQVVNSPRLVADAAAEANLALKRPVAGGAACVPPEAAERAVDGTAGANSRWCSLEPGASLQVDIGVARTLGTVVLRHPSAGGEGLAFNPRAFRILTSVDGSAWRVFAAVEGNVDGVTVSTADPVQARYVRVLVDVPVQAGTPVVRIYELEAYAA